MNILLTGGAGFIGSNLALKFIELGHNVTVLDSLSPQIHGQEPSNSALFKSIEGKVKFIKGCVTSKGDWKRALDGIHTVIHLAAETGTGQSMYQIQRYSNVNIGGTTILLDLLSNGDFQVEKLVLASSRSIYGEGKYHCKEHGTVYPLSRALSDLDNGTFEVKCPLCNSIVVDLPTDELSAIQPESHYAITKHTQEQMVMLIGRSLGISSVSLRFQNVYGPGQSLSNPYTGILSIFSTIIRNGNNINVFEDGEESRDFVYISDVVDSILLASLKEDANNQIFNVGSGVKTSVIDVANMLVQAYNSVSTVNITGEYRTGDIRHNYADLDKIKNTLGFKPKVNFNQGITKFVRWVKSQDIAVDKSCDSLLEMKERGLMK